MNAISAEHLPWDTEFFGFPVGRIVLPETAAEPVRLEETITQAGNVLTYVFLPAGNSATCETEKLRSALAGLGGKCRDLKTIYRKTMHPSCEKHNAGTCAIQMSPALEELAYASGWCSRFATDERLTPFFRPMYRIWLQRELARGKVFVRPNQNNPQGMTTVSIQNGIGKIGLVAVNTNSCGHGIGTALLQDVDYWLMQQGVGTCEVVTQGMNLSARRLYEKSGFALHVQMEVWHVWNDAQ